jgi:3-dehydroquinate synthase
MNTNTTSEVDNIININSKFSEIQLGNLQYSNLNKLINSEYNENKIIILVDENTHDYCLDHLINSNSRFENAEIILLPCGEENKVIEICYQVWEAFSEYNFSKKDLVINLGGGIVTDMGGFIASIYKRGLEFIHIPTSLLGMVDASIGGKTGIDLGNHKNQLGVFNHPKAIYIDPFFLNTLPAEEIIYGYAEMLKHALIRDEELWDGIKFINNDVDLTCDAVLKACIQIKVDIINEDPLEGGLRKILNFGHTIGHGIEGYFLDKKHLAHGHCVALGICAESFLSWQKGNLSKEEYLDIENCIRRSFHFISINADEITEIIKLIKNDKKNIDDNIKCCLLSGIGNCIYDQIITEQEVANALFHLNLLASSVN